MTNEITAWLSAHPEVTSLRVAVSDLNGVARGKRIPATHADKATNGGLRMPVSTLNVDIWGEDIADSPMVFKTGDADGRLDVTPRGLVPMSWFDTPSALLPLWMSRDDGLPFEGDPRRALARIVERFAHQGLTPVVATEMEFYLVDGKSPTPTPPISPLTKRVLGAQDVMSLAGLDAFDAFFTEVYAASAEMGIPADAAISECGTGQFEINLMHRPDALAAADDAWLFKMAVRGIARRHFMAASFMAKPYFEAPGNGLHTHFSLIDASGRNVFDDGTETGSNLMRHAVAGVLAAMRGSTLIFAPHFNSYRRMAPNNHAPTTAVWGYENRTAAIRIPGGPPSARRIEHRVAGGDTNPYLMLAAVLGAALNGIEDGGAPPAPLNGNAYATDMNEAPLLPKTWAEAISLFESDPEVARIFHPDLIQNFVATKRQEMARFEAEPEGEDRLALEFNAYLEQV